MQLRRAAKRRRLKKSLGAYKEIDVKTGRVKQKENKIELYVRKMLEKHGITFIQEKKVQYKKYKKKYDFLCYSEHSGYYFFIECDGSFWHARDYQSGKVPYSKLSAIQKKNIRNDQLKTFIADKMNVPLLRFWEEDIKFQTSAVEQKILEEINRQINLKNQSPGEFTPGHSQTNEQMIII